MRLSSINKRLSDCDLTHAEAVVGLSDEVKMRQEMLKIRKEKTTNG